MSPDARPGVPVESELSRRAVLPPISPWKIITGVGVVMVAITAVVIALGWMATGGLTGQDLVTARLDALKVGLSLGVGTGGLFALYLTWRRQRAIEAELDNRERELLHQLQTAADANTDATERRVTELYTKAVDQLGADKAPVRLGGLYALERLAQDNLEHRQTVVNVLCAYLRMPYQIPGVAPTDDDDQRRHDEHRERTQEREVRLAAQRILADHLTPEDVDRFWDGISLDLTGANLIDFDLHACRVGPARFERATFTGLARFDRATFTGLARFDQATFTGAAHFDGATFTGDVSFDGATGMRGDLPMSSDVDLAELLELGDPYAFDPADTWKPRPARGRLRVKIGIQADGTPIELDLKRSTQGGMGPHGLLVGATGSGKSELLRTLVLALAVTHPPCSLNFVLIDFKGGATFTRLDSLPHTSAVITNMVDELSLVDRMTESLEGEVLRRQELLREAGDFASLLDYEQARAAGAPLAEVPTLLVICDEFSELLFAKPDLIDIFVRIGRIGRSLGVHLLLASQRLEEGRLRGLERHLPYRIGLRTFSGADSRAVLGVPDAFRLPRAPGHGFLKVGAEPMERFRAAYVSGVYRPAGSGAVAPSADSAGVLPLHDAFEHTEPDDATAADAAWGPDDEAAGETLLEILVDRMHGRGTPAHPVWLPPLGESEPLSTLLPPLATDPGRGFTVTEDSGLHGALRAVVGVLDLPLKQRRDPLVLDLSGDAGHVVVVGGPQSGKTTLLRTLIVSLALTHTPLQVQFYCLGFGGRGFGALHGLPHVGGVADRRDASAVRRTVADVAQVLRDREERFDKHHIDGMASYRQAWHKGRFGDDPYGDVFLVVDGWLTLRNEFDDLEEKITDLATRGLAYGVHVVVSCARWFDLRPGIRDLFGTKLELRLGDPVDSFLNRKAAANVPAGAPGRGITDAGHHMLIGLPRVDGSTRTDDLTAGVKHLVDRIATEWPMRRCAPPVRMLPNRVEFASLPRGGAGDALSIGIAEEDLEPVYLWPATDPHFLVFGDTESGKTNFLRVVAHRIAEAYTPEQARILLVDYRRSLLGEIGDEYLLGYGTNDAHSRGLFAEVADAMTQRLPGQDVTPDQLRARTWWKGPRIVVLVDDYDMVATHKEHPLMALLPLVAQGADIGLHVVLARRTGGAGRGLFEPFLERLREVGTPGLMMSGDRDEGPLLGGMHAQVLPPGRGWLVDRQGNKRVIQLAWLPPAATPASSP
jgi:S-DNA-T family DNA segregation ATPase FtsK/SpoIIIE